MCSLFSQKKRKRPGQRRKGWTEPTEIKETRRAERSDVDLSIGGEGSTLVARALALDNSQSPMI